MGNCSSVTILESGQKGSKSAQTDPVDPRQEWRIRHRATRIHAHLDRMPWTLAGARRIDFQEVLAGVVAGEYESASTWRLEATVADTIPAPPPTLEDWMVDDDEPTVEVETPWVFDDPDAEAEEPALPATKAATVPPAEKPTAVVDGARFGRFVVETSYVKRHAGKNSVYAYLVCDCGKSQEHAYPGWRLMNGQRPWCACRRPR